MNSSYEYLAELSKGRAFPEPPPYKYRVLFGLLYIVLTTTALTLYLPLIIIFNVYRKFRNNSCYWIMTALGLCDVIMLIGEIGIGVLVVARSPNEIEPEAVRMKLFEPAVRTTLWFEKVPKKIVTA
ncbi:hypothetical protein QR680_010102 [Steinernema hermaphroditum]|uniref:Uncharacterized protein n=1 Tax=Steinernema hermaphroditum TaxID=289476 RepID=A0AA39IPE5_9BILA|nr:hypothetical protein QR680_010102 [Steinernema hermaphroditum]